MSKIAAALILVAMFLCVGWMDYEPTVEEEVWAVRCSKQIVTYIAPERISLDKEIALCANK